jgi:peptidoglycan/xylan/chitin deacetylase (PgdA/CDA1 family)
MYTARSVSTSDPCAAALGARAAAGRAVRPLASLSLDLDNQWAYMKTRGDRRWRSFPSYLDVAVPRVLSHLRERGLVATVFVVGKDAAIDGHADVLRSIADAGHEVGNHSFRHEAWLDLYALDELRAELAAAEECLERVTGHVPVGFRAPSFGISERTVEELIRRGYLYDASSLPTVIGPVARRYFLARARGLSPEERSKSQRLFGSLGDGFKPINPYRWRVSGKDLIEIPVTTMPGFRVPFHVSYVMFLGGFSPRLALSYFRAGLLLCGLCRVAPSILLHPLDFLGCEDVPELSFFPGMQLPRERKLEIVGRALDIASARFAIVPLRTHAEEAGKRSDLRIVASPAWHGA